MKPLVLFAAGACLLALPAHDGRAEPTAAELNGQLDLAPTDGKLNETEIKLGLIHKSKPKNLPALRDLDGTKRREAIAAILKAAEYDENASTDSARLKGFYRRYSLKPADAPFPLASIVPEAFGIDRMYQAGASIAEEATRPQVSLWDAALRRTKDQVLKAMREPGTDYEPFAEGALFQFRRDWDKEIDSLSFEGTLGLSWSLATNERYDASYVPEGAEQTVGRTHPELGSLDSREIYFLTSINRFDDDRAIAAEDRAKPASNPDEKDSLAFEFGLTQLQSWALREVRDAQGKRVRTIFGEGPLWVHALGVSSGLSYTTDSEFRSAIWAGNLLFEPMWNIPGMNRWLPIGKGKNRFGRQSPLLGLRFSLTCGIQGGTEEEEGSSDFDRKEDGFLYAGFTFALDIDVLPILLDHRLALRASYSQWEGLLSGVEGVQDFRASLRYYLPLFWGPARLREAGGVKAQPTILEPGMLTWALELAYRHGQDPITLKADHSLTFGASLAF